MWLGHARNNICTIWNSSKFFKLECSLTVWWISSRAAYTTRDDQNLKRSLEFDQGNHYYYCPIAWNNGASPTDERLFHVKCWNRKTEYTRWRGSELKVVDEKNAAVTETRIKQIKRTLREGEIKEENLVNWSHVRYTTSHCILYLNIIDFFRDKHEEWMG